MGDTAHMPYGDKSPERLRAYSMGIAERLLDQGCKMLVIACNSASSNALEDVRAMAGPDIPVVDVVHPVVDWAAQRHPGGRLALIGTRATVQSGMYESLMEASGLSVASRATPLLAIAIEEGFYNGTISTAVVEAYFTDGWASDKEALNNHTYPLVMQDIQAQLPGDVAVLDAPQIVAQRVEDVLAARQGLATSETTASI